MADPTAKASPDRGHEALRQDILAAVTELNETTGDTATGLDLTDTLFEFIGEIFSSLDALNSRADTAQDAVDHLQRRVAALESPEVTP